MTTNKYVPKKAEATKLANWPDDAVLERAIDMAFKVNEAMAELRSRDRGRFLRELFDDAELVWCVWRDAGEPDLFHCEIVKGADRTGHVEMTAFLVPGSDFAEKMRVGMGDGAPVITHSMPGAIQ